MRSRALLPLGATFGKLTAPERYRRVTLATLASLILIMVTGAAVRLTDSGMGCSTWPSCEPDSFVPRSAADGHTMVEFVNRLITGLVMLFSITAVTGAWRQRHQRPDLFRWSLGVPAWVLGNAVVGGLVVLLHLAPLSVIGHFLLSLGAVWNALVLHERAGERPHPSGARRPLAVPSLVAASRLLLGVAAVVIVTGTIVTGSGPHAGDQAAERLDFSVGEVARLHGMSLILFLSLVLVVLWMARQGEATPGVQRRLGSLLAVVVAQAAVGYTQYFTGVPALLVGVHVLGAALVWVAVLRVILGLSEPVPADAVVAAGDGERAAGPRPAPLGAPAPAGGAAWTAAGTEATASRASRATRP